MNPLNQVANPQGLATVAPEAELAALRERVSQLERLAVVGELTAGILHEIRNPLNFILNFANLSAELTTELADFTAKLPEATDAEEFADVREMLADNLVRIQENSNRATRIIQSMLAQTRGEAPKFEATDLNALLEEFTKLTYHGLRAADSSFNVSLVFRLDPSMGLVSLVPNDFNRVILNLMLNACYAVHEHSKRQPSTYKPTITVSSHKLTDGIDVRIRDNGAGISDDVKQQLFTPFFTTKPTGKGTGLGLSLSRDIVHKLHQGKLSVASEPGVFTEFCIWLPSNAANS